MSWDDDNFNPPAIGGSNELFDDENNNTTPESWEKVLEETTPGAAKATGSKPTKPEPTDSKKTTGTVPAKKKVISTKNVKIKEEPPLADDEKDIGIEDPLAEKLRLERKQKESDMKLTREVFSGTGDNILPSLSGVISLEAYKPVDEKEFEKFAEALAFKIVQFEQSFHYVPFIKSLIKKSVGNLKSDDIKDLVACLTVIQNEKLLKEKDKKKKKSTSKKNLAVKDDPQEDDVVYDEYDFMS